MSETSLKNFHVPRFIKNASNSIGNNQRRDMKDLTFSNAIKSVSREVDLPTKAVEGIALDLLSARVVDEEFNREMESLVGEILNSLFEVDEVEYQETVEYDPAALGNIMSTSIYNLDDDEDIKLRIEKDQHWLNDGSAPVDDLVRLEVQGIEYFARPNYYPINENQDDVKVVTGFIGMYSYSNESGDIFKSTGDSIEIRIEDVEDTDKIAAALLGKGYQLSELLKIKFYGLHLHEVVGERDYVENEIKSLVEHSKEFPNVLYAIPNRADVERLMGDDSIYSSLNKLIQDEILYGRVAEEVLDKHGFNLWSYGREFYDIRLPQIHQELREAEFTKRSIKRVKSKASFKNNFTDAVKDINDLNSGELTILDLIQTPDSHRVGRILYTAKSQDFSHRIESKPIYLQLLALVKKLNSSQYQERGIARWPERSPYDETQLLAQSYIDSINEGEVVSTDLNDEDVVQIFTLLWDRSKPEARINRDKIKIYFDLKRRYQQVTKQVAAA